MVYYVSVGTIYHGIPQPACRVGDMSPTFQERGDLFFLRLPGGVANSQGQDGLFAAIPVLVHNGYKVWQQGLLQGAVG